MRSLKLLTAKRCIQRAPMLVLTLLATLSNCLPALAQNKIWKIDEKTSSVEFSVKHLMLSNVNGRFSKFDGSVNYDGKDLAPATVVANISTGSISTKNQMRDKHLTAEDILGAALFPKITFTSKRIVPSADGNFDIVGTLSLHGVEKEVTLHATPLKLKKDANNEEHLSTTASTEIARKDFNVFVDKAIDKGGALVSETVKVKLKIDLVEAS